MLPGFRFRKGITLFPGLRLNLSKSGISTSIGKRGATVNLSNKGTNATVGAPGTGLSYRKHLGGKNVGYYGFLAILLAFYVLYLFYTHTFPPFIQSAIDAHNRSEQTATPIDNNQAIEPVVPAKKPVHRRKHKKTHASSPESEGF